MLYPINGAAQSDQQAFRVFSPNPQTLLLPSYWGHIVAQASLCAEGKMNQGRQPGRQDLWW